MKDRPARITDVLALLCLTVFALGVLLSLLTGAGIYRRLVAAGETAHDRRTALQYLTTRVRQAELVEIGTLEGQEVLVLRETVDNETYTTWVYCYEGFLRELYGVPGARLPLKAGAAIAQAESFRLEQAGDLLSVTLGEDVLHLHLPGERTVGP